MDDKERALEHKSRINSDIGNLISISTTDDLPEVYDHILENIEFASKDQISILLEAMGRPKELTKIQLEKRDIQRELHVRLGFAEGLPTELNFKSERQEILRWAAQLPDTKNGEPLNNTEQSIKNLHNENKHDELYKKIHRWFYDESEKHYPTPLEDFR